MIIITSHAYTNTHIICIYTCTHTYTRIQIYTPHIIHVRWKHCECPPVCYYIIWPSSSVYKCNVDISENIKITNPILNYD